MKVDRASQAEQQKNRGRHGALSNRRLLPQLAFLDPSAPNRSLNYWWIG
jgi:hypothetical protein